MGALSAGQYGATSNIWFELNEYGCIDLIYIIDGGLNANDPDGAGGSAASRYPTPVVDPRYESIYDAAGIDVTVRSNGTDIDVTVNKEAFQKWMQTATAEAKADIYGAGYGYVAGIAFPVPEGVTYTNGYYKWQRGDGSAHAFAATDYDSVNKNINLFVYFTNTSGNFMSGGDWTFEVDWNGNFAANDITVTYTVHLRLV